MTGVFHFTDTITLGSILIGVIIVLPALFSIVRGSVWRANATAAEETIRVISEGREAYRQKAERLEVDKNDALSELADVRVRLAEQEARPTQETVIQLIEAMDRRASDRTAKALEGIEKIISAHDRRAQERADASTERAQERHEMQMGVMVEIARTLTALRADLPTQRKDTA